MWRADREHSSPLFAFLRRAIAIKEDSQNNKSFLLFSRPYLRFRRVIHPGQRVSAALSVAARHTWLHIFMRRSSSASRRNNTPHENAVNDAWGIAEEALKRLNNAVKCDGKFEWVVADKMAMPDVVHAIAQLLPLVNHPQNSDEVERQTRGHIANLRKDSIILLRDESRLDEAAAFAADAAMHFADLLIAWAPQQHAIKHLRRYLSKTLDHWAYVEEDRGSLSLARYLFGRADVIANNAHERSYLGSSKEQQLLGGPPAHLPQAPLQPTALPFNLPPLHLPPAHLDGIARLPPPPQPPPPAAPVPVPVPVPPPAPQRAPHPPAAPIAAGAIVVTVDVDDEDDDAGPPVKKAKNAGESGDPSSSGASGAGQARSKKERLAELSNMCADGTISQDEHDRHRERILSEI
jgi:hypothetical protein